MQKLSEEQIQEILQALDDAIQEGPWEASNFLRAIGKNLREVRDNFANKTGVHSQNPAALEQTLSKRIAMRTGQQEVFIGLYSTNGANLQAWERILANLPRQVISRPIYATEQDIKNIIKSKEVLINEAYIAAYINQDDILPTPPEKTPTDKFGKPLILLKDRSLQLENIIHFMHLSGTYHYIKGRLVKSSV